MLKDKWEDFKDVLERKGFSSATIDQMKIYFYAGATALMLELQEGSQDCNSEDESHSMISKYVEELEEFHNG